ncbi:copper amine oxidase N-terminal domain-containing protein [Paenibacillus soyae]|uniref:Copper amine oxidase N-terminal domain-containing protein n=1 Tax=Paenibacillus soyae TaxID=2969249 RepID=A0A9X2MSD3_9BACL|nr:copper amine oxidase N-terminal domain-containing protein [Paenibacillus soyae]MCR2805495.1 copper amine oxidase N-terminal domain-containing protein [Paenibacillus soyae]
MSNKMGKTLLGTLSVTVLSLTSATAIYANTNGGSLPGSIQPIKAEVGQEQLEPAAHYMSVKGTVEAINDHGQNKDMQLVTVKTADGATTHLVVSEQTYLLDELKVGAEIIGFYDANLPVIMIYPPQYSAVAIAEVDNGRNVKVDQFDENLISADGTLKLNVADATEIIHTDGTAYDGELAGQDLIVVYGPSTRSIPAQTTPEQIVVLPEQGEQDVDQAAFASVTGTIQEIAEPEQEDASYQQFITVETQEGETIHLTISEQAYVDEKLAVGAEIIAFYDANAPMLMIYPPRYDVEAVALVKDDRSVMVDRFDETLLNSDGSLKLNVTDETKVVTQDGAAFEGDLTDRKLFVEYQAVQLSYPGQTTPTRIVVLNERETADESGVIIKDLNNLEEKPWLVNGQSVEAPSAYANEEGTVMVPLRAIAEALGYELTWEAETRTVRVGPVISLQIGEDYYVYAKMAPIELGTAPVLSDGVTYVPISFFKQVIRAEEVRIDAEQIAIRE